ncbi:TetR/AcrR family transcriptional regulator [Kordia sp.]|uniref:TetR/AcrR family transcriptional regulator n=1 Tax=Kordia sp. TaxID=1965332 RepID=UPI003B594630
MSKTKEKILSISRMLFNTHGYSNVTIRMIAIEAKMSSGNLNYHFKKRDDILEALYFEMVAVFDRRIKQLNTTEITLETVKEQIVSGLQRMIDYRFFWTDLYNLLKLNTKIKSHFLNAHKERTKGYHYLFEILIGKKILNDFAFDRESSFLIERMINYSNTWLYNSFVYEIEINDDDIIQYAQNLMGILYPYFTDLGKKQYKELFPKLFV